MSTASDNPSQIAIPPLEIALGGGYVAVHTFSDSSGKRGVMLLDTDSPHVVGSEIGDPPEPSHQPMPGELYISFTNVESAMVLRDAIDIVIAGLKSDSHDTEVTNVRRSRAG